jgi:hypothetical protein
MNSDQKYVVPKLKKLSPEEAKLFLQEQAAPGDQGAKDLLALLFRTK